MRQQERAQQRGEGNSLSYRSTCRKRSTGLQIRMALSYVWVTAILVFMLEILAALGLSYLFLSVIAPFTYTLEVRQTATHFALAASLQAQTSSLNPQSTFEEGRTGTLTLPGGSSSSNDVPVSYFPAQAPATQHPFAVALLIASNGRIVASSYPQHYPLNMPASLALPGRASLINDALVGKEGSGQDSVAADTVYAVGPVWSRQMRPIGAIYVQVTQLPSIHTIFVLSPQLLHIVIISGLALLILLAPISGLFGMMSMRGMIYRIRMLVTATSHFASGAYEQRVHVTRHDEIGQLEQHFNAMAQQLALSMRQQRILTEQNTRLAERTRMSRDLHDSIKQQVFALATQIGTALALLEHKREETRTHLEMASELAYQVRQDLTALIQDLRPPALLEKGFVQALQDYLKRWSRQSNIPTDIQLQDVSQLPETTAEELLRVVQEALSNVARHSQATLVQLSLVQEGQQIVLTLSDNGHGFDPLTVASQNMVQYPTYEKNLLSPPTPADDIDNSIGAMPKTSSSFALGLQSMQERVEEVGGTLHIQSSIGKGTQIVACCPLSAQINNEQYETS